MGGGGADAQGAAGGRAAATAAARRALRAGPGGDHAAGACGPPGTPGAAALGADPLPARARAGGNPPARAAAARVGLAAAWRWRRCLALLPAARRSGRFSRERQLRAAALPSRGPTARYGPPAPRVTAGEYGASPGGEAPRPPPRVRQSERQWEGLSYRGLAASPPLTPAGPRGFDPQVAAVLP
ncbi:hypothetical protein AMQ83_13870, partial [Paenibacillus riograndensis]